MQGSALDLSLDVDDLYATFNAAVKARKGSDRQTLRRPRFVAPKGSSAQKKSRRDTYFRRWGTFLNRVGLRTLNDWQKQGWEVPSHGELAAVFYHCLFENASEEGLTPYAQEALASRAAAHVLSVWDPDYTANWQRWGRLGGLKSKRPKKFTTQMLEGMEGFTIRQTAEALGCSVATAKRVRARYRLEQAAREALREARTRKANFVSFFDTQITRTRKQVQAGPMGRIWTTVTTYRTPGMIEPLVT